MFQELWSHQRNVGVDAVPSEGLGLFSEWKMEASSLLDVTSCIQQHLVESHRKMSSFNFDLFGVSKFPFTGLFVTSSWDIFEDPGDSTLTLTFPRT